MFYVHVLTPEVLVLLGVILWALAIVMVAQARRWKLFPYVLLFPPMALYVLADRAVSTESIRKRLRRRSLVAQSRRAELSRQVEALQARVESLESERAAK